MQLYLHHHELYTNQIMTAAPETCSMDETGRMDFSVVSSLGDIHTSPWNKADNQALAENILKENGM